MKGFLYVIHQSLVHVVWNGTNNEITVKEQVYSKIAIFTTKLFS